MFLLPIFTKNDMILPHLFLPLLQSPLISPRSSWRRQIVQRKLELRMYIAFHQSEHCLGSPTPVSYLVFLLPFLSVMCAINCFEIWLPSVFSSLSCETETLTLWNICMRALFAWLIQSDLVRDREFGNTIATNISDKDKYLRHNWIASLPENVRSFKST